MTSDGVCWQVTTNSEGYNANGSGGVGSSGLADTITPSDSITDVIKSSSYDRHAGSPCLSALSPLQVPEQPSHSRLRSTTRPFRKLLQLMQDHLIAWPCTVVYDRLGPRSRSEQLLGLMTCSALPGQCYASALTVLQSPWHDA